jgi:hypothetical protein
MKAKIILLLLVAFFAGRCLAENEQTKPGASAASESPGASQGISGHTPSGTYTKSGHYLEVPRWIAALGCQSTPKFFPHDVDWAGDSNTITLKTAEDSAEEIAEGTYLVAKVWEKFPGSPETVRGDGAIEFTTKLPVGVVVEVYLPGGSSGLGRIECGFSYPSFTPTPTMTTAPTANSGNADVCSKVRNSVSDELALAVDLFNSYSISLTDLGQIFQYWAELNQSVLGTTSGSVKSALKTLIGHAKSIGAAARNGDSYTAANYVVKFTDALGPMNSACR